MIVHDTLGQSGRSGTVDDIALVRGFDARFGERARRGIPYRMVVKPAVTGWPYTDKTGLKVVAESMTQSVDAFEMFVACNDRTRCRVLNHAGHCLVCNRAVEWHGAKAGTDDAEHRFGRLIGIRHQDDDTIAFDETGIEKCVPDSRRTDAKIGPADNASVELERRFCTEKLGIQCDNVRYQKRPRRKPRHLMSPHPHVTDRRADTQISTSVEY